MSDPRVVSLAPSATATVTALGAAEILVGVTNHCDLSEDAGATHGMDSPAALGGWLNPDLDRVADPIRRRPHQRRAPERSRRRLPRARVRRSAPRPATLDEVVATFAARGADVGRSEAGDRLAAEARERLDRIRRRGRGSPAPDRLL